MKEKIVFLAGGLWQMPFVKYLKQKGHFVAVVNPIVTDTTLLADYHIVKDVNDLDGISEHIEKINPIFITSDQSDISTLAVAKLSEKHNLIGNNVNVIEKFTNKYEIFKSARSSNIPVPQTQLVNTIDDIKEFGDVNGFPIIIKPTDATMSRGFRKINTVKDNSEEILVAAKKFSKQGQMIVQTFIPGDMITLEGICSGNKHRTIASSIKNGYFKPGITQEVRYPSTISSTILEKVIADNDRYVEAAGMKFGLTHSEYIINDTGYYLIEIGGRGGGAGITDKIVPWVSGINPYDILYESLLGKTVNLDNISLLQRPALLKYYEENSVKNYTDDILAIKGVASFHHNFIGKQYIKDLNDSRHSMAIYLGSSEKELEQVLSQVHKCLGNL